MSSEPGPKTTTLGVSIADNITLRSATIVAVQPADTRRGTRPGGAVLAQFPPRMVGTDSYGIETTVPGQP